MCISNINSCVWLCQLFKQASLVSELKSWCLSKLQNIEVRFTGDPCRTGLQHTSFVTKGLDETDGAGLSELPYGQIGSSQSLELHISPDHSPGEAIVTGEGSTNHYVVVHVESSLGKASTNC